MKRFSIVLFLFALPLFSLGLALSPIEGWFFNANAQENFPDLTIESASYAIAAESAELRFTLANRGQVASPATTFRWRWVTAAGSELASSAPIVLGPLSPDGTTLRSFVGEGSVWPVLFSAIPATGARIKITIDESNAVPESNEDNNTVETLPITQNTSGEDLAEIDESLVADEIAEEAAQEEVEPTPSTEEEIAPPPAGEEQVQPEPEQAPAPTPSQESRRYEPNILPGNPLYFFKNTGREFRSFFTFDSEKKADLRLRYASEKILEANKLVDQGKERALSSHLKSYEKDLTRFQGLTKKLEGKNPEAAEKLVEKSLNNQLKHQILIGKFERKATVDTLDDIKEIRIKTIDHIGQTLSTIDDSQKVQKITETALTPNGSPFKSIRNLEVLKQIEEKVPAQAKDAIQRVQENSIKRFADQLGALSEEHQALFSGYIENAGGNEISYLKTFENISAEDASENAQDQIQEARERLIFRVETKVEEAQAKSPELATKIFAHLSEGTAENIRVIQEFENSANTFVLSHVLERKQEALKGFAENFKDEKFAEKETRKFDDVKQLILFEDVKKIASKDSQAGIDKATQSVAGSIVEKIKEAKSDSQKESFAKNITGISPESIITIDKVFSSDRAVRDILLKKQIEQIEKSIEKIEDFKQVERIQKELSFGKTKQIVTQLKPEIFERAAQKTEMGQMIEELIKRQETLQKRVDAVYEKLFVSPSAKKLPASFYAAKLQIITNAASLNAQRQLSKTQEALSKSFERLSSGLRINTAADDAAGLAVSEKMRASVRSLSQASRNAQDGISLLQTAEGGYSAVANILARMRELATQSANGAVTDPARESIHSEYESLRSEIDRITTATVFNGIALLDGSFVEVTFQVGAGTADVVDTINVSFSSARSSALGLDRVRLVSRAEAEAAERVADVKIQELASIKRTNTEKARSLFAVYEREEQKIISILREVETVWSKKKAEVPPQKAVEPMPIKEHTTTIPKLELPKIEIPLLKQPIVPVICTKEYRPVCGVDGTTYSNRCVAENQNKMKVAYEGECRKEETIKPTAPINLYPKPMVFNPSTLYEDDVATVSAEVFNAQGATAAGRSTAILQILGSDYETLALDSIPVVIGPIGGGSFETATWFQVWKAKTGVYSALVCIDDADEVRESDEEDNCVSLDFIVYPAAAKELLQQESSSLQTP